MREVQTEFRTLDGVQCVALHHKGHHVHPATCIAATTPELIVGILNSVFFTFLIFFLIFKYSVTLAKYRHTP